MPIESRRSAVATVPYPARRSRYRLAVQTRRRCRDRQVHTGASGLPLSRWARKSVQCCTGKVALGKRGTRYIAHWRPPICLSLASGDGCNRIPLHGRRSLSEPGSSVSFQAREMEGEQSLPSPTRSQASGLGRSALQHGPHYFHLHAVRVLASGREVADCRLPCRVLCNCNTGARARRNLHLPQPQWSLVPNPSRVLISLIALTSFA